MNTRGALGESAPQRPGGRAPRGLSAPPGPPRHPGRVSQHLPAGPAPPPPATRTVASGAAIHLPHSRLLLVETAGAICSGRFPLFIGTFSGGAQLCLPTFCRSLFKSTRSIGPLPFCPLRPTRLPSRPPAPLFQAAIRFKSIFSKGEKLITVPGPRQPQCGGHVAGQARPGRRAAGSAPSGPGRVLTQAGRGSSGLRERGRRLRDHSGTVGQAGGAGLWRRLSSRQGADGGVVGGLCFYSPPLCFKLS